MTVTVSEVRLLRDSSAELPGLVGAVALVCAAMLGFRFTPIAGLTAGTAAVVLMSPVWVTVISRYPGVRWLLGTALVAVVWGLFLTATAWPERDVGVSLVVTGVGTLLTYLFGVGLMLWVREVAGSAATATAFGVGMFLSAAIAMHGPNVWKYYLAMPATVLLLGVASRAPRNVILAVLMLLALSGVLSDFRSLAGICLLTAALWYWKDRRYPGVRRVSRMRLFLVLVVSVIAGYFLLTTAMSSGLLGETIQQRTLAEQSYGGSSLTGGRPEWAGTIELMKSQPMGFGVGALPSSHDIAVALHGLYSTGVPTVRGYAVHFLFDGGFKLHSVTADLWAGYGIAGLVLAVVLIVLLIRVLVNSLVDPDIGVVALLTSAYSLFQMAVGPIWTSMPFICLAFGLGLARRDPVASPEAVVTAPEGAEQVTSGA